MGTPVSINPWGKSNEGLDNEEIKEYPPYNSDYAQVAMFISATQEQHELDWIETESGPFTILTLVDKTDKDYSFVFKNGHFTSLQGFSMFRAKTEGMGVSHATREEALAEAKKRIEKERR